MSLQGESNPKPSADQHQGAPSPGQLGRAMIDTAYGHQRDSYRQPGQAEAREFVGNVFKTHSWLQDKKFFAGIGVGILLILAWKGWKEMTRVKN